MPRAEIITGGHPDHWLSCDATIFIDECKDLTVSLYLPNRQDQGQKHVYITDGINAQLELLERGKITDVRFKTASHHLRILCSRGEVSKTNDLRVLGVVLIGIANSGNSINVARMKTPSTNSVVNLRPPHYWIVYDHLDKNFYKKQSSVKFVGEDAVTHYLAFGWAEGLEPHSYFDSKAYMKQANITPTAMTAPFVHYLTVGRFLGIPGHAEDIRKPSARSITHGQYADQLLSDKIVAMLNAIGVETRFIDEIKMSRVIRFMFDASEYRKKHDLHASVSVQESFLRYIVFDYQRGAAPGALFDEEYYGSVLGESPEKETERSLFRHWLTTGVGNRVSPTPLFDATAYLRMNPDLSTYPNWLFEHWLLHGLSEGLRFDANLRVARNRNWDESHQDSKATGLATFVRSAARDPRMVRTILDMRNFRDSATFQDLIEEANKIDPNVGSVGLDTLSLTPPLHDEDFASFLDIVKDAPEGSFDAMVMMPFCKLGGADFVAGVITGELKALGLNPIVVRTEQSDWERPDWFPTSVPTIDISGKIGAFVGNLRQRALYEVIRHIAPKCVINVNSRLTFETFDKFGSRLKLITDLYCYYFCSDLTTDGHEAGYPVWYFAPVLPHLAGALFDTEFLRKTLIERHALSPQLASKLHVLHTPAMNPVAEVAKVDEQLRRSSQNERPRIVWAGRFDRQKRFDLLVDIARQAPEMDFRCWGKAVLDAPPDMSSLPANIEVNGPFAVYDDLKLEDCDGWLYTSSWDGMPTIVIEIAQMGMPMVASAVGGIPELIDDATGWPQPADASVADYVAALRRMIADPDMRRRKAHMLRDRVMKIHSREAYRRKLESLLANGSR